MGFWKEVWKGIGDFLLIRPYSPPPKVDYSEMYREELRERYTTEASGTTGATNGDNIAHNGVTTGVAPLQPTMVPGTINTPIVLTDPPKKKIRRTAKRTPKPR